MRRYTAPRLLRSHACLLLATLIASACASPAYYTQAVSGHLELMKNRQPVEDVLSDPETGPELRRKLELAEEIRAFGAETLGLPANDTYSRFVRTGRDAASWNVVAAPEFSLEAKTWCFPVAGCVPYRGYFEREAALRFAAKLEARGYDVSVTPAVAYSTLGWFEDPLLDTMLAGGEADLAAILFHEMAHQHLYLKGDTVFSESFASFVEETGVTLWLESRNAGERLEAWQDGRRAAQQFQSLLESYHARLERLYASEQARGQMRTEKARLFDELKGDWKRLSEDQWPGRDYFAAWLERDLNNARLALVQSYRGGSCAFGRLYRESGHDLRRFLQLATDVSKLGKSQRSDWLQKPCSPIAPEHDL